MALRSHQPDDLVLSALLRRTPGGAPDGGVLPALLGQTQDDGWDDIRPDLEPYDPEDSGESETPVAGSDPPSWGDTIYRAGKSATGRAIRGIGGVLQAAEETSPKTPLEQAAATLGGPLAVAAFKAATDDPTLTALLGETPSLGRQIARSAQPTIEAGTLPEGATTAQQYVHGAVSSVAENAPLAAAAIAFKNPAIALGPMSAMSGGEKFHELRSRGEGLGKSLIAGGGYGTAEYVGERIPLGILFKESLPVIKRVLGYAAADIPGEMLTEALQWGIDRGIVGEETTLGDAIARVRDAGIIAAIAGPLQVGAIYPMARAAGGGKRPAPSKPGLAPDAEPPPTGGEPPPSWEQGPAPPREEREAAAGAPEGESPSETQADPILTALLADDETETPGAEGEAGAVLPIVERNRAESRIDTPTIETETAPTPEPQPTEPPTPKQAKVRRGPLSVVEWVRSGGGLRPGADVQSDWLAAAGFKEARTTGIVDKNAKMASDEVVEEAIRSGYIPEGSSESDLMDAISRDVQAKQAGNVAARVYGWDAPDSWLDAIAEAEAARTDEEVPFSRKRAEGEGSGRRQGELFAGAPTQGDRLAAQAKGPIQAREPDLAALPLFGDQARQSNLFTDDMGRSRQAGLPDAVPVADRWRGHMRAIVERARAAQARKTPAELAEENARLTLDARTDALTGLLNRRAFGEASKEAGGESVMAFADLDNFKAINDALGHPAGDSVLRAAAATARELKLEMFRTGGDEFGMVVGTAAEARAAMEAFRRGVEATIVDYTDPDGVRYPLPKRLGVSYGIGRTYREADADLYRDKERRARAGLREGKDDRSRGTPGGSQEGGPAGQVEGRAFPLHAAERDSDRIAPDEAASAVSDLRKEIGRYLGRPIPKSAYRAVPAPDESAGLAEDVSRAFGKGIVWVKNSRSDIFNFNAAVLPGRLDLIFISVDSDSPFLSSAGHELTHFLKRDHPDLYSSLTEAIKKIARASSASRERLDRARAREGKGAASDVLAIDEFVAEVVGERFADEGFWSEIAAQQPGTFSRLVDAVLEWLSRIASRIRGSEYVFDVKRARSAIFDAFAEYARRTGERPPSPKAAGKGPKFSRGAEEEGAAREEYAGRTRRVFDLPEIVELAVELMNGRHPAIVRRIRSPRAAGVFRPGGEGRISVRADLFKDSANAAKVLAHEIGHLADYLPDRTLKRGNILGHVAALKGYIKATLAEYPGAPGEALTHKDRIRLRREAERAAGKRERTVETTEKVEREVPLRAEEITAIWTDIAAREKDPGLYEYIARLTDEEKAAISRAALKGRIPDWVAFRRMIAEYVVRKRVVYEQGDPIEEYKKLVKREIEMRRLYERETIMRELKALTREWNPFDDNKVSRAYREYRDQPAELYAEAVSVLLHDPGKLQAQAPTFHKAFFSWMGARPDVKAAYDEIEKRIADRSAVLAARSGRLRAGFARGERALSRAAEKKSEAKPLLEEIKYELLDRNEAVIRKVKTSLARGEPVSDEDNPIYALEEAAYTSSEAREYLRDMQERVVDPLRGAGVDLTDLAEVLLYERIIGERGEIANPGGIDFQAAAEGLDDLFRRIGEQRGKVLRDAVKEYRAVRRETIISALVASGRLSPALRAKIEKNDSYATFRVVAWLEGTHGRASGLAKIFKQVGTLGDVVNPFTATIVKDLSLIKWLNNQRAAESVVKFLQDHYPGEIKPAETKWNGKGHEAIEPADDALGLVVYLEGGEARAYYVDKYIADSVKRKPRESGLIAETLRRTNVVWKNVFVIRNPGFWAFNLIRDYRRAAINLEGASLTRFLPTYLKAIRPGFQASFGIAPQDIRDMARSKMLISVESSRGLTTEDEELERQLVRFGLSPRKWSGRFGRTFGAVWDALGKVGEAVEAIPKIAGKRWLETHSPELGRHKLAHMVRVQIGSPDFRRQGAAYGLTNNLLLFSNAIKEGWRGDFEAARERPGEYAWKMAKYSLLPKMVMYAAILGLLGDWWKRRMEDASAFDLSNYIVVPLGVDAEGNTIYLRAPLDESGRFLGGLLWKALTARKAEDLSAMFDYMAGQAPALTPTISLPLDLVQYFSGKNPYDWFRGRPAVPDLEFEAGGARAHKEFAQHIGREIGAGNVVQMDRGGPERPKGTVGKILSIPAVGPFIGRFVKVGRVGDRQDMAREARQARRGAANLTLDAREEITRSINAAGGKPTLRDMADVYLDLRGRGVIPLTTSAMQFRHTYNRYAARAVGDPALDALASAQAAGEKAAILRRLRQKRGETEYMEVVRQAIIEGTVTPLSLAEEMSPNFRLMRPSDAAASGSSGDRE